MYKKLSYLVINCLLITINVLKANNSTKENDIMKSYKSELVTLEEEWSLNPNVSFFVKALQLSREASANNAARESGVDYYTFQLDLASAVLIKNLKDIDVRSDYSAPGRVQALVMGTLASENIDRIKNFESWPELRARYARLLMLQRSLWISLRDPNLDEETIEIDSTLRIGERDLTESLERMNRNRKISFQFDLIRFMDNTAPLFDRFMVEAFSLEPVDIRLLEELLVLGRYSPEDRIKIMENVERKIE